MAPYTGGVEHGFFHYGEPPHDLDYYRDGRLIDREGCLVRWQPPPKPVPERIGDTHRAEAFRLLHEAFTQGFITMDEFDERITLVSQAAYAADLRYLTEDLPVQFRWESPRQTFKEIESPELLTRREAISGALTDTTVYGGLVCVLFLVFTSSWFMGLSGAMVVLGVALGLHLHKVGKPL